MHDVYFVMTVVSHSYAGNISRFIHENGADYLMGLPGEGTATSELLNLLGLEATKKTVFFTVATREIKKKLMRNLVHQMGLDMLNAGIAVSIPLSAIGGATALKLLIGSQIADKVLTESEEKNMNNDTPYSLICVIANNGCTDMVMDAARSASATGGTVLHVKGTGSANAEKFFGMSIVDEKEMILIAAAKKQASDIMKAVMTKCGATNKAHAVCFSLPVDQIAGFNLDCD